MIRTSAAALAIALGFTATACAQDAPPAETQPASASETGTSSGFNLKIPGEEPAESYGGFNLSIPSEESTSGFNLPNTPIRENAFGGLPDADTAPAPADEDEIIRLDP